MSNIEYVDIETERLLLRKYRNTDEKEILAFLNENREFLKEVIEANEYEAKTLDAVGKVIRGKEVGWLLKRFLTYGIWTKVDNKYVGQVMFFKIDWRNGQAEIGSYIGQAYQRQGIITEAKKASLNYIFLKTKIQRVDAICKADNFATHKVNIKCGFQKESEKDGFIKFFLKN